MVANQFVLNHSNNKRDRACIYFKEINQFVLNVSNNKRDGVCIYFKEFLAVCIVGTQYMNGCIIFEVFPKNTNGYTVLLYIHLLYIHGYYLLSPSMFLEISYLDQFLSNITIRKQ